MASRVDKFDFQGTRIAGVPVFMTGKPVDGRQNYTSSYLSALLKTTTMMMRDRAHAPAVKIGHATGMGDRSQQPRRGHIERLYRGKIDAPSGLGKIDALKADLIVDRALANDYGAGKYPGVSAELYPLYWMENAADTSKCEWYIDAIAFLGEDNPAFPELFKGQTPPKQFFSVAEIQFQEEKPMDSEKMNALLATIHEQADAFGALEGGEPFDTAAAQEALDAMLASCTELQAVLDEYSAETGEEEPEAEAPAEEVGDELHAKHQSWYEKFVTRFGKPRPTAQKRGSTAILGLSATERVLAAKIAGLEALLTAQKQSESDKIFQSLVADGRVTIQERDIFDAIAAARGLDYARNHFAAQPSNRGPVQKRIKDLGDVLKDAGNDEFMAQLDKLGYSAKQKMDTYNAYLEAEKAGMVVDHAKLIRGVN